MQRQDQNASRIAAQLIFNSTNDNANMWLGGSNVNDEVPRLSNDNDCTVKKKISSHTKLKSTLRSDRELYRYNNKQLQSSNSNINTRSITPTLITTTNNTNTNINNNINNRSSSAAFNTKNSSNFKYLKKNLQKVSSLGIKTNSRKKSASNTNNISDLNLQYISSSSSSILSSDNDDDDEDKSINSDNLYFSSSSVKSSPQLHPHDISKFDSPDLSLSASSSPLQSHNRFIEDVINSDSDDNISIHSKTFIDFTTSNNYKTDILKSTPSNSPIQSPTQIFHSPLHSPKPMQHELVDNLHYKDRKINTDKHEFSPRNITPRKKKRDIIKRTLKSTQFTNHHRKIKQKVIGSSSNNNRINDKKKTKKKKHFLIFDEDKPWKSHNEIEFLNQRERKRYEGVWVTNRYQYLKLLPWWDELMNDSIPNSPIDDNDIVNDGEEPKIIISKEKNKNTIDIEKDKNITPPSNSSKFSDSHLHSHSHTSEKIFKKLSRPVPKHLLHDINKDIDKKEQSPPLSKDNKTKSNKKLKYKVNYPIDLPEEGLILNLVVFEIWKRSYLNNELLCQIYNMVDTRKDGTLTRQSFLVGMWLVDQCLYGRKLPKELNKNVWLSALGLGIDLNTYEKYNKKQEKERMKQIKKKQTSKQSNK